MIIGEDTEEDAEVTAEVTASSDVEEVDGAVLPDIGVFLNCARGEDKEYGSSSRFVSYSFDLDNGPAAVAEIIDLLQEPQYELSLVNTKEKDYISDSAQLFQYYEFSYTGTENVPTVTDDKIYESSYDVLVSAYYNYSGSGRTVLTIYYSNGFTFVEPGTAAETQPVDYTGSGSSSGSSSGSTYNNDDDDSKTGLTTMCIKCHGTKKVECSNCDGKGYKEVYIRTPNYSGHSDTSTTAYEKCIKCHGEKEVTCPRCDGTGYEP